MQQRQPKTSTINLKGMPGIHLPEPFAELEYDPIRREITLWRGRAWDHCEGSWCYEDVKQARQMKFTVPGIPYQFVLLSGQLYCRPL